MVTVKQAQTGGLVTLVMILLGFVIVDNVENTYYCEPEDSVKEFVRLSASKITGYDALNRGDRCVGGTWQLITDVISVPIQVEEAIQYIEDFGDYPQLTGEARITRVWRLNNDENLRVAWEVPIFNVRDNVTELLRGNFKIPKDRRQNETFIINLLTSEVEREFTDYNKTFIPNPEIDHTDHSLLNRRIPIAALD